MASVLREKRIKSADRVLEIFEMFDGSRQSVTVMEVARTLNVPQSSTSELLNCLSRRGYLIRDRQARTYRPSARVALLGAWVQPERFRQGRLLPMMDTIHERCGHSVVLASEVDFLLHHLHAVGADLPRAMGGGTSHHLLHSPFGLMLQTEVYREQLRKVVHRLNAESEPEQRVRFGELAERVDQFNRQGYAIGEMACGLSGIAMLLPQGNPRDEMLAIGVIGPSGEILEHMGDVVRELRGAIAQFLAPEGRVGHSVVEMPRLAAVH